MQNVVEGQKRPARENDQTTQYNAPPTQAVTTESQEDLTPRKPTFAQMAAAAVQHHMEASPETDRASILQNATTAARALFGRHKPPPSARSKAEEKSNLRLVYVSGIQRSPISNIRQHLRSLSVRTSQIEEIQFCGKETVEFLLRADYADAFIRCMKSLRGEVRAQYDPIKPPARGGETTVPADILAAAKQNFAARMKRAIERRPESIGAKFFAAFCEENSVTTDPPITSVSSTP